MTEALATETVPVQDCDREPIHIPEAIQPHGFLLVIDADSGAIVRGAGDIADLTGFHDWTRRPLVDLIGPAVAGAAGHERKRAAQRLAGPSPVPA